jgi:hypothetical protein
MASAGRSAALFLLAGLAACSKSDGPANRSADYYGQPLNEAGPSPPPPDNGADQPPPVDGNAIVGAEGPLPALIPPAPGEAGGLPDDRAPLDESPIEPTSVRGAGLVAQRYAGALEQGRFADAFRLWRKGSDGPAAAGGLTVEQLTAGWARYQDLRILVGRPDAGGTDTAVVPIQAYGRYRSSRRPFNLAGQLILARNPAAQGPGGKGTPWFIVDTRLSEQGRVREQAPANGAAPAVSPVAGASTTIPAAYQGRWAASAAACDMAGDSSRLTVTAGQLAFYESMGRVTSAVETTPGTLRVTAAYEGEGQRWTATRRFVLAPDGRALTIEGVRRVRCAS